MENKDRVPLDLDPHVIEKLCTLADRLGVSPDDVATALIAVGIPGLEKDPNYLRTPDYSLKVTEKIEELRKKNRGFD